ncbi:MAG: arylsulfatase B [Opitutaceae bacterium]
MQPARPFTRLVRLLACIAPLCAAAAPAPRPNVIYFLADDLGWTDVGWHGGDIATPNLDRLAAAGAKLEQFYVLPVCSPTRAAFLTGRYPIRHGLQIGVVRPWAQYGLPLSETTLAQALGGAGYATAIAGKWHLGHFRPEYLPTRRGFQSQYGHFNGALDYFTHQRDGGHDWHRDDRENRDAGYTTVLVGDEAVRVVEAADPAKPFFLYVPFNAPHTPLQAPEEYLRRYAHVSDPKRRSYSAMVACLDDQVGRVVAALARRGLTERTLIAFSSDNGGPITLGATNGPLRGQKGTVYEGGVRVPAFATWPGVIPAGTSVHAPLHIVDWYPTLRRLAGITAAPALPLDGRDAWATITAGAPSPHEAILLNAYPRGGAVRMGEWKLVRNGEIGANDLPEAPTATGKKKGGKKAAAPAETLELFNLAADPGERENLAPRHPEIVQRLAARLDAFTREALPPKAEAAPAGFRAPRVWGQPD